METNDDPTTRRRHGSRLSHFLHAVHRLEHKAVAKATVGAHLAYYGLVSFEAHGNYRWAAAAVGVLLLAEAFGGSDPEGGMPA